jgi:hypothetical protein
MSINSVYFSLEFLEVDRLVADFSSVLRVNFYR